jgi:hypothetical protein
LRRVNIVVGRGRSGVGHPEITDSERRHADQIKVGKVQEVDYAKAKVRVLIGDESDDDGHMVTGWLPMPGARARNDVRSGTRSKLASASWCYPNPASCKTAS